MPGFGIGPNLATYGSRGRSPSLVSFGQNEQDMADQELGSAATQETRRNAFNTQVRPEPRPATSSSAPRSVDWPAARQPARNGAARPARGAR